MTADGGITGTDHPGMGGRRDAHLRAGGQHLFSGATLAWAASILTAGDVGRPRRPGEDGAGQRWRDSDPGILRPWCSALGPHRARPVVRHEQRDPAGHTSPARRSTRSGTRSATSSTSSSEQRRRSASSVPTAGATASELVVQTQADLLTGGRRSARSPRSRPSAPPTRPGPPSANGRGRRWRGHRLRRPGRGWRRQIARRAALGRRDAPCTQRRSRRLQSMRCRQWNQWRGRDHVQGADNGPVPRRRMAGSNSIHASGRVPPPTHVLRRRTTWRVRFASTRPYGNGGGHRRRPADYSFTPASGILTRQPTAPAHPHPALTHGLFRAAARDRTFCYADGTPRSWSSIPPGRCRGVPPSIRSALCR